MQMKLSATQVICKCLTSQVVNTEFGVQFQRHVNVWRLYIIITDCNVQINFALSVKKTKLKLCKVAELYFRGTATIFSGQE